MTETTFRIPLADLTLPAGEHILSISLHHSETPSSDLHIGGITLVALGIATPIFFFRSLPRC